MNPSLTNDPAWDRVVNTLRAYLPDLTYKGDIEQLSKTGKAEVLFLINDTVRKGGGCKRCREVASYVLLQYIGSLTEMMVIESFRNAAHSKVREFAEKNNLFFGHLVGLQQDFKTTLDDIVQQDCSCDDEN